MMLVVVFLSSAFGMSQGGHRGDVLARQRPRASHRSLRVGSRQRVLVRPASRPALLRGPTHEGARFRRASRRPSRIANFRY